MPVLEAPKFGIDGRKAVRSLSLTQVLHAHDADCRVVAPQRQGIRDVTRGSLEASKRTAFDIGALLDDQLRVCR